MTASITPNSRPVPPWDAIPAGLLITIQCGSSAIMELRNASITDLGTRAAWRSGTVTGGIRTESPSLSLNAGLILPLLTRT